MVEDLEQEGYLALYPAIDGYDPAHGVKFLTYADRWIRQRMQRYLQMNGSSVRLPVGRVEEVRKYNRVCDQFQQVSGREATARELSRILGLTLEEVEQLQLDARRCNRIPLDTPISGADGQIGTVGDMVASAEKLNIEPTTVTRLHQKAIATCYKPETRYKLQRFLPEYWQAKAYQGAEVGTFQRTWTSSTERAALKLYTDC